MSISTKPTLALYNTRTRRKEAFVPLSPEHVGLYSCGPTVYARQHLGNLRAYVFADTLKRALGFFGHRVRHVINVTDVGHLTDDADAGEDKMENAARAEGLNAREIADRYTAIFQQDLTRLRVLPPDVWARATGHIAEQIELVRRLEGRGITYRTTDGIYFDTSRDPHYGELSGASTDEQRAQARIAASADKRNPADFALWKLSPRDGPNRQMEWPSPWGVGFPGWHLECTAMSVAHLGERFDIHTGGIDHVAVHHTNEIAQAEAAYGVRPWVPFWLHGGWLLYGGKMSKSRGETIHLDQLIERGIHPLSYRYFLLGAHYRSELAFTDQAIADADRSYRRLRRRLDELRGGDDRPSARYEERRRELAAAIGDDLGTPRVLAAIWDAIRTDDLSPADTLRLAADADEVLGIGLSEPFREEVADAAAIEAPAIEALVEERELARVRRAFDEADALRDRLKELGVVVEDGADGPRWRRA